MSDPEEDSEGSLNRLGERLDALESARKRTVRPFVDSSGAGDGYRLLGTLIGGVLVGLGLGYLLDRLAGIAPIGLIGGLLVGTGASIFQIARQASRTSGTGARAESKARPKTGDPGDR